MPSYQSSSPLSFLSLCLIGFLTRNLGFLGNVHVASGVSVWYLAITSLNSVSIIDVLFGLLRTENVILASFWWRSCVLILDCVLTRFLISLSASFSEIGSVSISSTVYLVLELFVLGILSQASVFVHFSFQLFVETSSRLPF